MGKIAVFMDRDGTINEEVGYVDRFDKFRILPEVPGAIRKMNHQGIPLILITNQSGVGRGYFSPEFLDALHRRMMDGLEKEGCRLDGIYVCPHHPDDHCACRKPRPGMLLRAAKEKGLTLHNSYVIGDKLVDVRLAHDVGAKGILVLTGYGAEELRSAGRKSDGKPDHIAANLNEAVEWILGEVRSKKLEGRRQKAEGRRILIVKPSSLGDIIHSLPVLWFLRKRFPDAWIGWVVKEVWKEILKGNPLLDEIIVLKKGVRGLLSTIGEVRRGRYETIIDLQGLSRSGMIALLSGASERIGFSNAREFAHLFYNRKIIVPPGYMHAVDRYLLAVDYSHPESSLCHPDPETSSGVSGSQKTLKQTSTGEIPKQVRDDTVSIRDDNPHFPLYIDIEDSEWARNFLLENRIFNVRPLIAINPSARWGKKRWPPYLYAALINQLIQEAKAGIIILGSKGDIPIAEEISSLVKGRAVLAAGKTSLKTLTALLDRIDLLVTNDSGPMHIAAALERPVIALFGPTDPRLTGPYGGKYIVLRKEMECSPCFRRPCRHGKPLCMESITVEEVLGAVKQLINEKT